MKLFSIVICLVLTAQTSADTQLCGQLSSANGTTLITRSNGKKYTVLNPSNLPLPLDGTNVCVLGVIWHSTPSTITISSIWQRRQPQLNLRYFLRGGCR